MSTALQIQQPAAPTRWYDNREQIELCKRTYFKGATDDELEFFLTVSRRLDLDVFAKQIFPVKRWDSTLKREVIAVQVSIDGFRLVADRTGCYAPGSATVYEHDGKRLVSATAFVRKWLHGQWVESGETAYYDEYVQTTKDGTPNHMWKTKQRVMLAKCAEARALRRSFPHELSGVYADEEIEERTDRPARVSMVPTAAAQAEPIADAEIVAEPQDETRFVAYLVEHIEQYTAEQMRDRAVIASLADAKKMLSPDGVKAVHAAWRKRADELASEVQP